MVAVRSRALWDDEGLETHTKTSSALINYILKDEFLENLQNRKRGIISWERKFDRIMLFRGVNLLHNFSMIFSVATILYNVSMKSLPRIILVYFRRYLYDYSLLLISIKMSFSETRRRGK